MLPWVCPSCARRVPSTVTLCRCGHQWTGTEIAADSVTAAPVDRHAPEKRGGLWVGPALAVLLVATGLLVWRASRPALHPAALEVTAPVAGENLLPDAASGASADRTAPGTFAWPADPSLWKTASSGPEAPVAPAALALPRVSRPAAGRATLEDVIDASLPAVVLVQTPAGRGTGFFISPDTVVTNAHVVEAQSYVSLRLSSGETLQGRVMQRSDELDLAAIRTTDARVEQLVLSLSASPARIGQEVIAIGSPLGLQNTVTRGIVSGLRQAGMVTLVQTDAAINPGNSGGPLLDREGRVVAVATMRMGGRAEALGFGVAADHVRALLEGRTGSRSGTRAARPNETFTPDHADGADGERDSAQSTYERFLAEAARRADQLDRSWDDFVAECLDKKAPSTRGDRGWFALWERFDEARVSPACVRFYADFKFAANDFNSRMIEAADRARRGGVYPGVCRELRHRHRIDWAEW